MVTHGNLMHNAEALCQAQRTDASSVQLSWLPPFHDTGLIHGILQPVYAGIPCIRMSPLAVVKHPVRWLRAVQRYRVTHTGGPNFAYELCVRRVGPEARHGLDLSSLRCLYSAAEPIRAATLEAFFEAFAGSGLRAEAFFPAYGLAEATLIVTGATAGEGWRSRALEAAQLEQAGTATPAGPGARARRLVELRTRRAGHDGADRGSRAPRAGAAAARRRDLGRRPECREGLLGQRRRHRSDVRRAPRGLRGHRGCAPAISASWTRTARRSSPGASRTS